MDIRIKELYYSETDSNRLAIDQDPEYTQANRRFSDHLDQLQERMDPKEHDLLCEEVLRLVEQSDLVCFAHGIKLGFRLALWALRGAL